MSNKMKQTPRKTTLAKTAVKRYNILFIDRMRSENSVKGLNEDATMTQNIENRAFPGLTSSISFRSLKASNRIVHQPMECDDSPNGFPSESTLKRYRRLAEGAAGITIVEATSVGANRARINQLMVDEDHRQGIDTLTKAFKDTNSEPLLFYQITHAGQISGDFHQAGIPRSEVVRAYEPTGFDRKPGRLLSSENIDEIIEAFIKSAIIIHDSGADGVDIKFCHGYLGGQLLRPANNRDWEYGGSLRNRMRFPERIINGIKEKIPDTCIMVRISIDEGDMTTSGEPMPGGIGTKGPDSTEHSLEEPLEMIRMLKSYGIDIINITAGIPAYNADICSRPSKPPASFDVGDPETYAEYHHLAYPIEVKKLDLGIPVIATGFSAFGKNVAQVGENVIQHSFADMIGIGRQTLADPNVERILSGEADYCVRCNGCAKLLVGQVAVGCSRYDEKSRERLKKLG